MVATTVTLSTPYAPSEWSGSPRKRGFTLLEMVISATLIVVLSAAALSVASETTTFVSFANADYTVQYEAQRAFQRLAALLRKCGWNTVGTITYPTVEDSGSALEFNLLTDADGNGYPFAAATGELEWGSAIYRAALDEESGEFWVRDADGAGVHLLGRHITAVDFSTYLEAPLHYKEVRISITTTMDSPSGEPLTYVMAGSVHMRN